MYDLTCICPCAFLWLRERGRATWLGLHPPTSTRSAERERREDRVQPVRLDARLLELRCLGILVEYEAVDLDGDGLGDR